MMYACKENKRNKSFSVDFGVYQLHLNAPPWLHALPFREM